MYGIRDVTSGVPPKGRWGKYPIVLIRQRGRHLDGCYFVYRRNPELSRHRSTVPASAFSAVLVQSPCDFVRHLACIQWCAVTAT